MGLIQIPLGLTLYGSPKVLFILFALAAFALLVAYFILSYLYDTEGHHGGSDHGAHTHYTGTSVVEDRPHHGGGGGIGGALAGGALGAGLASMFRRRPKSRTTSQAYEDSRTSLSDEKYSDESSRHGGGGWAKKMLELGALAGAGMLAKRWWDRRKERNRENDAESGRYRPAHTRNDSYSEESLSRLEDGPPEPTHRTPLNRPPSRPPSRPQSPGSSYYYNSTYFTEPPRKPSNGIRNAFLGAGAFAAVKKMFGRGGGGGDKDDEEKSRLEDIRHREEEDERLQRANSKRRQQSGAGAYPQRRHPSAYSDSELTPTDLTPRPRRRASHEESIITADPVATGAVHATPSDMPPLPPAHHEMSGDLRPERPYSHDGRDFATGAGAGAALGAVSSHRRNSGSRHRNGSRNRNDSRGRNDSRHREDHVESPPVSVKVKMHNDGRHVTLRRLTEEEVAAGREARRRDRRGSRRRTGSASSLSGDERSNDRWRRVEELERRQHEQMQRQQEAAGASMVSFGPQSQISDLPPPPPIPHPAGSNMPYGAGSVTSPGTWTGTEASGSYANNRRRRRAERARARQDRQQQNVEFE